MVRLYIIEQNVGLRLYLKKISKCLKNLYNIDYTFVADLLLPNSK